MVIEKSLSIPIFYKIDGAVTELRQFSWIQEQSIVTFLSMRVIYTDNRCVMSIFDCITLKFCSYITTAHKKTTTNNLYKI